MAARASNGALEAEHRSTHPSQRSRERIRPEGRVGALVVAAGSSRRMGGVDKLFAPLLGRPLIAYSVGCFSAHSWVDEVVLVLAHGSVGRGRRLVQEAGWRRVRVCAGGPRRQDSVARGLALLSDCTWVVVHDGARPCLEPELVQQGLEAARETGAAVAAVPVTDTVKRVDPAGLVLETPSREGLWSVQTPQVFRRELLAEAHRQVEETVTDDAAMVERLGRGVRVFLGSYSNLKVTTPTDLALAEAILRARCAPEG